jgi:hypothetical protein
MVLSSLSSGLQGSSFIIGSLLILFSVWLSYAAYVQGWVKHCIRLYESLGRHPGRLLIPWWLVAGIGLSELLVALYLFLVDLATPAVQLGLLFHVFCVGVSGTLIWLGVKIRAIQRNHRTTKKKAA